MRRVVPYLLLTVVCGALFFWRLGSAPLIGFDEGIYAECSREMLAGGNWLVPDYNGEPLCDKPPLVYWLQAGSMGAFGVSSFAARLPSALAAAALVALAVLLGARTYGRRAGIFAGFVLASTLLTAALGRLCLLDEVFTLTIALSLGAFLLSFAGAWPRWGYVLFWAFMGLSVMVKGPAGAVLILATVGVFLILTRRLRRFVETMPLVGMLVFAAVALPWYIMAERATGGAFLREFLMHQNLARALGRDFHHNLPFLFYIPIYVLLFFPWSAFVPAAWRRLVHLRPSDLASEASLFAAVWILAVVAVFSLSRSKLGSYINPAFPPSALLVGALWADVVDGRKPRSLERGAAAAVVFAALVAAALVKGPALLPEPIRGLETALVPMGLVLVVGTGAAFLLLKANRAEGAFAALCAGTAGFLLAAVMLGLPIAARKLSQPVVEMAHVVREAVPARNPVYSYNLNPPQPGLAFYARRHVPTRDKPGELQRALDTGGSVAVVAQEDRLEGLPEGGKLLARHKPYVLYEYSRQRR